MTLFRNKYRIESARLKDWDYSTTGFYFITICVKNRINLFGNIINREMILNEYGKIADQEWEQTGIMRENIELYESIIMPDHFHGIIRILLPSGDALPGVSTGENISNIIRGFKSSTTSKINKLRNTPGIQIWQPRFYDRIIRDERELNNVRNYIIKNPSKFEG